MMNTKWSFKNSIQVLNRLEIKNGFQQPTEKWVKSSNQYLVPMQQLFKSLWLHKQQEMSTSTKKNYV